MPWTTWSFTEMHVVPVAAHELEVRLGTAGEDDLGCRGIQLSVVTPGAISAHGIQRGRRDQARLDHRAQLRRRLVQGATKSHQEAAMPRASSAA
jgi:hypothetical protein